MIGLNKATIVFSGVVMLLSIASLALVIRLKLPLIDPFVPGFGPVRPTAAA